MYRSTFKTVGRKCLPILAVGATFVAAATCTFAAGASVTPGGGTTVMVTGGSSAPASGGLTYSTSVTPSVSFAPNASLGGGGTPPVVPLVPEPDPAVPVVIGVGLIGVMAAMKKFRPVQGSGKLAL